jgi:hypothetical protein
MTQQISIEDALEGFRSQHGKLADENVLLRAQVTGLERQLAAAREENERLKRAPGQASLGPDLAAQPPYSDEPQESVYDGPR